MKTPLKCVLLVDDNFADNYFHSTEIKKINPEFVVIEKTMALDAIKYLEWNQKTKFLPELIFLDVNMPGMNGWEFLEKFTKLSLADQNIKIIMLSTSKSEEEIRKAETYPMVMDYIKKPLTEDIMRGLMEKYFLIK